MLCLLFSNLRNKAACCGDYLKESNRGLLLSLGAESGPKKKMIKDIVILSRIEMETIFENFTSVLFSSKLKISCIPVQSNYRII